MRVQEYNAGSEERLVLVGMILDRSVLSQVSAMWKPPGLFSTPWCNIVGSWCVKYLRKYDSPPNGSIKTQFAGWASKSQSEATVALVDSFLSSLADEYPDGLTESPQYVLDLAQRVFKKASLEQLQVQLNAHLDLGEIEEAEKLLNDYQPTRLGLSGNVHLMQDNELWERALNPTSSETLINYPGDLGKFFGRSLARDSFVAIIAPEKRGKTTFLVDMAYRAMLQRRRVMFFEVGDMSLEQITQRFIVRCCERPIYPSNLLVPTSLKVEAVSGESGTKTYESCVEHREREFTDRLSDEEAKKIRDQVMEKRVKSRSSYLDILACPSHTITVDSIESHLMGLASSGWVADCVFIDYADLMVERSYDNLRDQTNAIWGKLRGLSQKLHCLIVTATQADAVSYTSNILDMRNFSEDKRKNAHVTGMFGINQKPEEKKKGVFRLNWVARREAEFHVSKCVYVAGCLGLGHPTMLSSF